MAAITANNIVISVQISDFFQDGVPSYTFLPEESINCLVRSYSRSSKLASLDLASITDTEDKLFFTRASGTVELEIYVDSTFGLAFPTYLYHYIKVKATIPYNGSTVVWMDEGVISDVSMSQDLDGILTESVTITLGTYGVDAYGGIV
jgi:hypothetical protein